MDGTSLGSIERWLLGLVLGTGDELIDGFALCFKDGYKEGSTDGSSLGWKEDDC